MWTPGNPGRKSPQIPEGFLTLLLRQGPEEQRDEQPRHQHDQIHASHNALRHRLRVESDTRSCAAARFAGR